MLFSALGPTTVYADDGAPPDTTTAETAEPEGESVDEGDAETQTDEAGEGEADETTPEAEVVDEAVEGEAEEAAPEEEVADETGEGEAEEATPEAEASAETDEGEADEIAAEEPSLIEQLPDNTEIVVVNAEGETEPLATEEAAAIVVTGDPMWCPSNAKPGDAGCSVPEVDGTIYYDPTSLASLLAYLAIYPPDGPGTIWIEDSYDSSVNDPTASEFVLDNNAVGNMSINNLTIQGGWDGNTDSNGTINGVSDFSVPIAIGSETNPWGGSVTIRNIVVSGVAGDTGLTVYSVGNVVVEDSEFVNNDVAGVFIDAGEDVTVNRSKVDDNGSNDWNVVDGKGLEIKSGGYVTLNGVIADDNQLFGADIVAVDDVAIANSSFNGNLMYTTNWAEFFGYGLTVVSQGEIALSGVEANDNFLWGASLEGSDVYIEDSFFNRNVTDSTSFIDDTGLIIVTPGDVALDNIQANENRLIGADIKADGQVDIQDSSFDRNFGTTEDAAGADVYHGFGLSVAGNVNASASMINLETVTADENYLFGANLFASGDVNIADSSFSNNVSPAEQGYGLMIDSGGAVELSNVVANDNGQFGANIQAVDYIEIEDSIFGNNLNSYGVWAQSAGYITLTNVNALDNAGDGAYADATCVYLDGGAFTSNDGYGLNVPKGFVNETSAPTYSDNGLGATNPNPFNPCQGGGVIIIVPTARSGAQYTATPLAQSQLPAALGQGNTFVSALKVTSQVANLAIELSFPIPAGMEDADLAVMFWDGAQWVELPGGSVVGGEFVITVTQPGIYVLVSR